MKQFLQQDSVTVGLIVGLGSITAATLLLTLGLLIAGEPAVDHLQWYAGCFVPPLLLLRYYIKQQRATVVKTLMTLIFLSFIPFMFILFRTHSIHLK